MTPNNIELHIEELVLHGFPARDHHLIGEAVQRELTRLLSERGIPGSLTRGGEVARLDGGSFSVKQGSKADVVGRQVAQAVFGGMKR